MQEKGRSMVEMLGVLAIIGILSAGAMAGYSKAMFQHKMNQTIDITTQMIQRIEDLAQKGKDISIYQDNAVQYGLLEKCDIIDNSYCRLPIGGVYIDFYDVDANDCYEGSPAGFGGTLNFRFTDAKSCIAFLSVHWEQMLPQEWWNPNGSLTVAGRHVYIKLYYPREDITNIPTMSEISNACQENCRDDICYVQLQYRNWC